MEKSYEVFDKTNRAQAEMQAQAAELRSDIQELEERIDHLDSTGQSLTMLLHRLHTKRTALTQMERLMDVQKQARRQPRY